MKVDISPDDGFPDEHEPLLAGEAEGGAHGGVLAAGHQGEAGRGAGHRAPGHLAVRHLGIRVDM